MNRSESENKLFISDFRKLGYEWRLYKGEKYIRCADCGLLVRKTSKNKKYCKECGKIFKRRSTNDVYCRDCVDNVKYYEPIETKTITCSDCGKEVEVKAWDMKICRCKECQNEKNKRIKREYKRNLKR